MSELNLSPIDRGSDLRTDAAKLEQLWKKAQIIQLVDARLLSMLVEFQNFQIALLKASVFF
jgi:hypothetical protein